MFAMNRWLEQGFRERILPFDSAAPEPTRRSRPTAAARAGRSARPTARSRPYAAPGTLPWCRATCGISRTRESRSSIPGRLVRADGERRDGFPYRGRLPVSRDWNEGLAQDLRDPARRIPTDLGRFGLRSSAGTTASITE